jgi:hypothetical protein
MAASGSRARERSQVGRRNHSPEANTRPTGLPRRAILQSALALALILLPAATAAQQVRGTVVDAASGTPVEGGLIRLVDDTGTSLPPRLTGAGGTYRLDAPAPGRYRVEAERIGYRRTISEPVELTGEVPVELHLAIEVEPVPLTGITVEGSQRCRIRQEISQAAARLWVEARRALTATALTSEEEVLRFQHTRWRRELDPIHLTVLEEDRTERSGASANPIQSLPAADLQANGYIRPAPDGGHLYYAPDAQVLLSDAFMDDHCFTVEEGRRDNSGLVGLGFQPVPGRTVPDVEGVLWLDRETAELRHLELRHTRQPYPVPTRHLGARVEFEGLPTGHWIVRRWWIRMPLVGMTRSRFQDRDLESLELQAIIEDGGEIFDVRTLRGMAALRSGGTIRGVVTDSSAVAATEGFAGPPRPLEGARVALNGTMYTARTDESGQFRMEGLPEGTYQAFISHPRLDSLAMNSPTVAVRVERGGEAEIHLAVPSAPTILSQHCPDMEPDAGAAVGQVLDREDRPARSARVEVSWSHFHLPGQDGRDPRSDIREWMEGIALPLDTRGRFRLCDVPAEMILRLQAVWTEGDDPEQRARRRPGPIEIVVIPPGGLAARVLRLPGGPNQE